MSYPLRQVRRSAQVDRKGHVLAVQTAPREPAYLARTLASLERAGAGRWAGPRLIVADGCMPEVPIGWPVFLVSAESQLGQARTFFRALEVAAAHPDFSALTLVEDDMVFARNALDYIAGVERDSDIVLHAWFTCEIRQPWGLVVPSFVEVPLLHQTSNAAVTLPAATVHALLASDIVKSWPVDRRHAGDLAYTGTFAQGRAAVHFPSLAQHIGDVSTVGNVEARVSRYFLGEAQDAMELRCVPSG